MRDAIVCWVLLLPPSGKLPWSMKTSKSNKASANRERGAMVMEGTCASRRNRRLSRIRCNKAPPFLRLSARTTHSATLPPLLFTSTTSTTMASESQSSNAVPHPHHPHGTETLAHIAVDYCPEACRHEPHAGEIHVTYDHRGGARWRSRRRFLPGSAVAATIRAPAGDTAGLNYNLYLSSLEGSRDMDEIDFEFLGHDKRAVQTNYHVEGGGGRERIHQLPFDSSDDFHHYAIAWDATAIEWRIDGELIRREERREGEAWPEKPMFLYASVWDASHIDEGRWTGTYHGRDAPYVCSYRDIRVPTIALSVDGEDECQDADAGAAAADKVVDAGCDKN